MKGTVEFLTIHGRQVHVRCGDIVALVSSSSVPMPDPAYLLLRTGLALEISDDTYGEVLPTWLDWAEERG